MKVAYTLKIPLICCNYGFTNTADAKPPGLAINYSFATFLIQVKIKVYEGNRTLYDPSIYIENSG